MNAARPKTAKLATNTRLRDEVQTRLNDKHSPEQIMARLRVEFPDDPEAWVSHETIYESIYVRGRGALKREVCQVNGGTVCDVFCVDPADRRPSKVIAKAFSAPFHRLGQRRRPFRLGQALQPLTHHDQAVPRCCGSDLGQHPHPVLGALTVTVLAGPQPEDVAGALGGDRQRDVDRPVLALGHAHDHPVGDRGNGLLRDVRAVDLGQIRGDLTERMHIESGPLAMIASLDLNYVGYAIVGYSC